MGETVSVSCVVCTHHHPERGMVCEACRTWADGILRDIAELHAQLPAALIPGASSHEHVSGTPEAPLPLQVAPLDLGMPARALTLTAAGRQHRDDQIGDLSVASVLKTWADYWREYLYRERPPRPTVPHLVRWMRDRLHWACDNHPAIDECVAELRDLRGRLRVVLGQTSPKGELLRVPCSKCDQLTLHRRPGDDRVHCQDDDCAAILYPDEYERWTQLLAAHHAAVS